MQLTHSHYCKHCDHTWQDTCEEDRYDLSFLHDCKARYVNGLRLRHILEPEKCVHGCNLNPCPHVKVEQELALARFGMWQQRQHEKFDYYYSMSEGICIDDTEPAMLCPESSCKLPYVELGAMEHHIQQRHPELWAKRKAA